MKTKTNLTKLLETWKIADLAKALGVTTAELRAWKTNDAGMPERVREEINNLLKGFMIV